MNRLPVILSSQADRDVVFNIDRVAEENILAAVTLSEAIENTTKLLASQPLLGERFVDPRLPELRRMLVSGFATYSIYYQVLSDHILVARLLHNSRDVHAAIHDPTN